MRIVNGKNIDYDARLEYCLSPLEYTKDLRADDGEQKEVPADALIKIIYSIDERTKLPTGDLSYYVSDKVNPEIKDFILKNLLMDVSVAAAPSIPTGIDDKLAHALSRQYNNGSLESVDSYRSRLENYALTNVDIAKSLFEDYHKKAETKDVHAES